MFDLHCDDVLLPPPPMKKKSHRHRHRRQLELWDHSCPSIRPRKMIDRFDSSFERIRDRVSLAILMLGSLPDRPHRLHDVGVDVFVVLVVDVASNDDDCPVRGHAELPP